MPLKVLVVDDTSTVRMFVKTLLGAEGFTFLEAGDGTQCLKVIERERPDVVLMDINMPNMNGIDCCRHIKDDSDTASIPVVMLTARGEGTQIDEAYRAGCDDYVTKPIRKIELLAKIRRLVGA